MRGRNERTIRYSTRGRTATFTFGYISANRASNPSRGVEDDLSARPMSKEAVLIKRAVDGDGFCLFYGDKKPVWFSREHHAINYAESLYPTFPILISESSDMVGRTIEATGKA